MSKSSAYIAIIFFWQVYIAIIITLIQTLLCSTSWAYMVVNSCCRPVANQIRSSFLWLCHHLIGRTHVYQPIFTWGCLLMCRLKEWLQILRRTCTASFLKFFAVYWIHTHCLEHRCLPWPFTPNISFNCLFLNFWFFEVSVIFFSSCFYFLLYFIPFHFVHVSLACLRCIFLSM